MMVTKFVIVKDSSNDFETAVKQETSPSHNT